MKKIFLVTLDYNSEKETHDCLASVKNLKIPKDCSFEVVVVDNASNQKFFLLPDEKKEKITVLRSEINTGFTGGNNIGIRYALSHQADYVMIINNDTIVDKNLLIELFSAIETNPEIGLVSPKIYFAKGHEYHKDRYKKEELGHVFWFAGGGVDWANAFTFHRGVDEVDHGQYDKQEEVEFATGCCMLLRRETLEKVGLFDDHYFLYFEDGDLCERVKKNGFKIVYVPTAKLWHITAASGGGSGSKLHDYFITRNRMRYGLAYAPFKTKIALIRESIRLFFTGRQWQKRAIGDFYTGNLGKGSFS